MENFNKILLAIHRAQDSLSEIPGLSANGLTMSDAFYIVKEWQASVKRLQKFDESVSHMFKVKAEL